MVSCTVASSRSGQVIDEQTCQRDCPGSRDQNRELVAFRPVDQYADMMQAGLDECADWKDDSEKSSGTTRLKRPLAPGPSSVMQIRASERSSTTRSAELSKPMTVSERIKARSGATRQTVVSPRRTGERKSSGSDSACALSVSSPTFSKFAQPGFCSGSV